MQDKTHKKLKIYAYEYADVILKQRKAIKEDDVDLLNNLITQKQRLIDKITQILSKIKDKKSAKKELNNILNDYKQIEKQNITDLKNKQKKVRNKLTSLDSKKSKFSTYKVLSKKTI